MKEYGKNYEGTLWHINEVPIETWPSFGNCNYDQQNIIDELFNCGAEYIMFKETNNEDYLYEDALYVALPKNRSTDLIIQIARFRPGEIDFECKYSGLDVIRMWWD